MKKQLLSILLIIATSQLTFGQYESPYKSESEASSVKAPNFFLGIGTGLNYKTGALGLSLAYRVAPKTLAELNMGIGFYGSKIGFGVVFNAINKGAWCPSLSFSRASGISDLETEVEVEYNGATSKTTTKINLAPMFTLTPGVQRQFVTKNGSRFILEIGFAIPMNTAAPEFSENFATVNNATVPTGLLKFSTTQKQIFEILNPAGLSFGLCYYFGFKPKN